MPKISFYGFATAALLMACSLVSCGSSSDSSPTGKCNALTAKVCARGIACFQDGTTQSECVAGANMDLPCAQADAVGAAYGSCMSDLDSISCAVLTANGTLNLPASCNGVILFQ
jgi:hypothetical protein